MNALVILHYGNQEVLKAFDGLSAEAWRQPGVTTHWSPRDVLAHLASFEAMLEDALKSLLGRGPTPTLDAFKQGGFSDAQVAARRERTPEEIMREYTTAHDRVMALARELGPERLRQAGTIPWYGPDYSADDLIVYTNYAHKREHCSQVKQFRMRLAPIGKG